jgi:cytochrome b pre-mRNA-processing protein 3
MVTRSILVHQLRNCQTSLRVTQHGVRLMGNIAKTPKPLPPTREKNWLTRKVESSSSAMKIFLKLTNLLGYGSPRQLAGRRAFALYDQVCAVKPDQDRLFWQDGVFGPNLYALPFMLQIFQNVVSHQPFSPGLP